MILFVQFKCDQILLGAPAGGGGIILLDQQVSAQGGGGALTITYTL